MSMFNLFIHRFLDCDNFPEGVNVKVKQKMLTLNLCKVTCEHCKRRIVDVVVRRDWADLSMAEARVLEEASLRVSYLATVKT